MTNTTNHRRQSPITLAACIAPYLFLLLLGWSITATAQNSTEVVSVNLAPLEAAEFLEENPDVVILDVRTPVEFYLSHIKNAININYYSFSFRSKLEKLDRDKIYLVHCQTGVRSGKTIPMMIEAGFANIYHMDDGFKGWKKANLPTT